MDQKTTENRASENPRPEHQDRAPYETPVLTDHGTVAELTQGAINVGGDIGVYS